MRRRNREVDATNWTTENLQRLFLAFNAFGDSPSTEDLWWRADGEYAPFTFLVNCNDLFYWGCSDAERIHPEDLDALEKAIHDAKAVGDGNHGHLLWIARKRGQRPQKAYYKYFKNKEFWDACGPKETQYGA